MCVRMSTNTSNSSSSIPGIVSTLDIRVTLAVINTMVKSVTLVQKHQQQRCLELPQR